MLRLWLFALIPLFAAISGQHSKGIRNLRARFEPTSNAIHVEWDAQESGSNVRYRVLNRDNSWKYVRTLERSTRLELSDVRNGDEVEVQVMSDEGGTEWSNPLIILVTKQVQVGDMLLDDDELLPPLNFAANIIGPTSVKLEWTANNRGSNGAYYIVTVKQLTSEKGEPSFRQQIKVESNSFVLSSLAPGERYEMTIRSANGPDSVSSTAAIVEITLPKEDEYFEVGNLIISSRFKGDGSGAVNLSWEVPPQMKERIVAYDVQYAPSGADFFKKIHFPGHNPVATLTDLKSDTEYTLKIKTLLHNQQETESGEFHFRTPKVSLNPISKVDVIFSSETSAVQIQWALESHILPYQVAGYDVYLSQHKDTPEDRWQYIRTEKSDTSLSLSDLQTSTTYYVKINVRQIDGTVINSPSIYRFTTIAQLPTRLESRLPNSLAYRNVGPGKVMISWSYPDSIVDSVMGATIFYTHRKHLPVTQWNKVTVENAVQRSVTLSELEEGTQYYVQIVPRMYEGTLNFDLAESFELRTDRGAENEISGRHRRSENNEKQKSSMRKKNKRVHMRISSCNPDAFEPGCKETERCIAVFEDSMLSSGKGWCVPESIRQAILTTAHSADE